MTYFSDTKPVTYMAAGPVFAGETLREAVGANTAHSLAGHLLHRPIQGVSRGPAIGHGFEHQPLNQAERAAQHTAQSVAQSHDTAPALDHATVATAIRQAVRPGTGAAGAVS